MPSFDQAVRRSSNSLLSFLIAMVGVLIWDSSLIEGSDAERKDSSSTVGKWVLTEFDRPFLFAYLSFENHVTHDSGVVRIKAKDGRGGAGIEFTADLSDHRDKSPVVRVRLRDGNQSKQFKLIFNDEQERKSVFVYELKDASQTKFTELIPVGAKALSADDLDLRALSGLQVQGAWTNDSVDLEFDQIVLMPANRSMLASRREAELIAIKKAEQQRQRERKAAAEKARKLEQGLAHPSDGPEVIHIGMAGERLIGLEIQAGRISPSRPMKYESQDGDRLKETGKPQLAWKDGRPAIVPGAIEVFRNDAKGRQRKLGVLVQQAGTVWSQQRVGEPLDLDVIDKPEAYRISIDGRDAFSPLAVYRKSKPNSVAMVSGDVTGQHFVYLKVPQPLAGDASVKVELFGLNTRQPFVEFKNDSKSVRSEAIHVSYLGYRPTDPVKRAYASLWTGTGGGQTPRVDRFELLNESGDIVFEGPSRLAIAQTQSEPFVNEKNHTQADVYHLDFGEFRTSGRFRVHVPNLGISYPFEIQSNRWSDAYKVSMHGFLSHRSGLELGPPFTSYLRPRNMHPDDETFKVFETDVTIWDGESDAIRSSLTRLLGKDLDPSRLKTLPRAWGGYMDAGDWDRRSQHLVCSLRLLELIEIAPSIAAVPLALPNGEATNAIPDTLDEVLWNVSFFKRLQDSEGGVRGGVESTAHPRPGEASWQESLLVGAFAPDPETTFRYAATAARVSCVLKRFDVSGDLATQYWESAELAWDWAEANGPGIIADAISRNANKAGQAKEATQSMRSLAAIELFRLTGMSRYRDAIDRDVVLSNADHAMAYALIPRDQADAGLRSDAINFIIQQADASLDFCGRNGFNIALSARYLPMMGYTCIWSTPGSVTPPVLPRAHYLTGEPKYLEGTILSCQYSGGANPMNLCYTTGIGERQPLAPLHLDCRRSGQEPPAGITVYGQSDPAMDYEFDRFAHTWFLNRFGGVDSHAWPTAEAYIDLGNWPSMNEYTVHQTFANTAYTWGYLSGRSPTRTNRPQR